MTQTVSKLLLEAVEYEQFNLAYSLFIAAQKGIVKMTDPVETIDYNKLPYEEIYQALANDTLKLQESAIKLFLIKRPSDGDYAVYLAKSQTEAYSLHSHLYGKHSYRVFDRTEMMDSSIYDESRKTYVSYREIKKQILQFPYFVCLLDAKRRKKAS